MMVMAFYGLVASNIFPDRLETFMLDMIHLYKPILHPSLVECLYGSISSGAQN
jgi:hypothetical protein